MRCGRCGLLIPQAKRRYKQKLCTCVETLLKPTIEKHEKENQCVPSTSTGPKTTSQGTSGRPAS